MQYSRRNAYRCGDGGDAGTIELVAQVRGAERVGQFGRTWCRKYEACMEEPSSWEIASSAGVGHRSRIVAPKGFSACSKKAARETNADGIRLEELEY